MAFPLDLVSPATVSAVSDTPATPAPLPCLAVALELARAATELALEVAHAHHARLPRRTGPALRGLQSADAALRQAARTFAGGAS